MKLFLVEIKATYNASYEGDIDKSYSELVVAENAEGAIDFVNNNLNEYRHLGGENRNAKAINAFEIDSNKAIKKRKTQFFTYKN